MDPVELLTILGNENRRSILQLLSFRPFYFNEIARRLDVGPKAVIDHLGKLEQAGLVECYQDQGRRKYFRIVDNLVLEVAVSPHTYGVRAYRPEVVVKEANDESPDLDQLQSRLDLLEEKRSHLRKLLEDIDSEVMELKRLAIDQIERSACDQLEAEIFAALLSGETSCITLANRLRMPSVVVEDYLERMAAEGKVKKKGNDWTL